MTTLGKILVFANLVFSVITGILITFVFAVRTNWHSEYTKRVEELNQAHANAQYYKDQLKTLADDKDTLANKIKEVEDKAKKDIDELNKNLVQKEDDKAKIDATGKGATAVSTDATAETKRLRDEVQNLLKAIGARDEKINLYEGLNKQVTDKAVQAEIAYQSEHQRLLQQLEINGNLAKELERVKSKGGLATTVAGGVDRKPPPEDVRGTILSADPKSGLVTISIGSDHGLVSGHTLEVFRVKPKPEYLGQIKILDARHHEAVARPTSAQKGGQIQKGDEVASRIMGQR